MIVVCPNPDCGATLRTDEANAGRRARCARCGAQFVIEAPEGRWQPGTVLLDEYEVERHLGAGGMGAVYLVRSRKTQRRFAAKRVLAKHLADERQRQSFLRELRTWIDLPDHPNLTACRFFRTVGEEVVIFAEYVDGGSLAEWVRDGRLYAGGPAAALERVLDVAIRFAWGLSAAHEAGVVHRDVKPGNVLMTAAGVAKVTDFGLARALGGGAEGVPGVAYGGMTPAFCSPQQRRREPLTGATDLWSWGLSVLAMFAGGAFWARKEGPTGHLAARVLQAFLRRPAAETHLPPMPPQVADVLARCFRDDPADRWPTLAAAADALAEAYASCLSRPYPRRRPAAAARGPGDIEHDRRTADGAAWDDPIDWLKEALRLDGRDPDEAEALVLARTGSRKAQVIADLAAYEEALSIYERLLAAGRNGLAEDLARLCAEKALVHVSADDLPGALRAQDRAIALYKRLVDEDGRTDLTRELARAHENKALAVETTGDGRAALALYDQALDLYERLVDEQGRTELRGELAAAYVNKATAVGDLGDERSAVELYDRAIAIQEHLVQEEGREDVAYALSQTYVNKAMALAILGDDASAVGLYDQAIAVRERLVNEEGHTELADALARAYVNKAFSLTHLKDDRSAVALYDQAIAIQERLVNEEGRADMADDLARTYVNKSIALRALGDRREAVALCERAIAVFERLVNEEGRTELAAELAKVYTNTAMSLEGLDDLPGAAAHYERSVAIRRRLVLEEGRAELAGALATAELWWADVAARLGRVDEARGVAQKAYAALEAEVTRTGNAGLADVLDWARENLGELLGD